MWATPTTHPPKCSPALLSTWLLLLLSLPCAEISLKPNTMTTWAVLMKYSRLQNWSRLSWAADNMCSTSVHRGTFQEGQGKLVTQIWQEAALWLARVVKTSRDFHDVPVPCRPDSQEACLAEQLRLRGYGTRYNNTDHFRVNNPYFSAVSSYTGTTYYTGFNRFGFSLSNCD